MQGSGKQYYIPNQWARIMMREAEQLMSSMEFGSLQKLMTPTGMMPGSIPNNMKKQFPFEHVSAIHKAVWNALGDDGAREYGLRVGHRIVEESLAQFKSVTMAAQIAMKVGSLDAKVKIAFEFFSKFFSAVSDEIIIVSDDGSGWNWMLSRCATCWNEPSDSPVCYVPVGMVQGILRWVKGDMQFSVSEVECIATGARHCTIRVDRM
jgi:predicted hydrocarbon binding protein